MLRTHNAGELRAEHINEEVVLCGWVQRIRDKGHMLWVDLRDRYGITQLIFEEEHKVLIEQARSLGREYVIKASGEVIERASKNPQLSTGDIEIKVTALEVLNASKLPPFLIEDETDGGEDLRMEHRYLDLRRTPVRNNLILRHQLAQAVRNYLDHLRFLEVETPVLIKSTPEGARDFVVPSRLHPGEFYALPQSPQTFKQLLMVSGFDRYFQIVKCFRDEDLRADRQPEFTQIDCEMAFVTQEDIFETFEGLMQKLFYDIKGVDLPAFKRMSYDEAIRKYGSDKPDLRFGMVFTELNDLVKGKGFKVFDDAELIAGVCAEGCAGYTRKQLDELTEFVKKPQIGARGLVYVKCEEDGSFKSSVDKFYGQEDLQQWAEAFGAGKGDLLLILAGNADKTRSALGELRLEMATRLKLRDPDQYVPLWVTDFPLLEYDEDEQRWFAMHHPFTSAKPEDEYLLDTDDYTKVRANAYDMVINGVEIGGGSIRIHDQERQAKMLQVLGFSEEEARQQFGFLTNAFAYGAPPHGGIAFGFDRLCALFGGSDSIRDYIAFPKNNAGRDVMIDSPAPITKDQLKELHIEVASENKVSQT